MGDNGVFDLDDIRAFVEVVETGGIGRAGARLGVSKSIVSRRVSRLESELGAQLLSRTTRRLAVTEAGVAFKTHADRALADLDAGREAVAQDGDAIVGALRVAAPLTFGVHLAPVLAELAVRHPRLEVHAAYSDRFVDLIGERFDAAVRLGSLPDSSLIARKIAPMRALVVASPVYLERHSAPLTPQDLAGHEALTQGDEVWRFGGVRREIAVRMQGRFTADTGQALVAAAEAGLGVAILPSFLVAPSIEKGALTPLLLDYPIPEAGLYVLRPPPAGHAPAKVRALTELMIERFGGEPVWDACHKHLKKISAA